MDKIEKKKIKKIAIMNKLEDTFQILKVGAIFDKKRERKKRKKMYQSLIIASPPTRPTRTALSRRVWCDASNTT
jgi:hypothetical protein